MPVTEIPLSLIPSTQVSIDGSQAVRGLAAQPHKVLLFGTKLAAGSAAALTPVIITREDQGDDLFGSGTPLAEMCRAFRRHNKIVELTVIPQVESGGGVVATSTITFTGTATAAGAVYMYIGGRRFVVPVAEGDTADDVCAAAEGVIDDDPRSPVDAAVDGVNANELDLSSKWKGASANSLVVVFNYYSEDESFPPGITATATAFASGANDPDVSAAIAVMGDKQYHTVLMPWTDTANLNALKTALETRWGPTATNEGLTVMGYRGNYSATQTFGNGRNSKTEVVIGTALSPTPPWMWAAIFSAVESQITDPAEPRFGRKLPDVLPPAPTARFDKTERELLLADGVSTYRVNEAGEVYTEAVLTTYQVNELDVPDSAFRWIETLRCASFFRQDMLVFLGTRFALHKLANDGDLIGPGQRVATPTLIRGAVLGRFAEYVFAARCEDAAGFEASLVVERHPDDPGRVDITTYPNFVNQLRNVAVRESFIV